MQDMSQKGSFSVDSENILPIIKKWLYSETDIFIRELVSNASDAIGKLKHLSNLGEVTLAEDENFCIKLILDKDAGTISIEDNGLGMTAEEIGRYINQIAFSGAAEFIDKYKDKIGDESGVIGHFGLGFYSAFMAAATVTIDTLSYKADSKPARWISNGTNFEITDSDKTERGTRITLSISEDAKEFLEDYKLRTILKKYCSFIPVDIYFENAASKTEDSENKPINDTSPIWLKKAQSLEDQDYKRFYHQVFSDFNEPLFWIHLNMDYPFRLKGILYFPKFRNELDGMEGQVKLFCNQVFVADNIKEVIPEFLLLLKGVVDCPDLPLNVSRSFLQNDEYVQKMSGYIVRKIADKLVSLIGNNREEYEKYWQEIHKFIKYGCIRENGFYEKCKDAILYKDTDGIFCTIAEYKEKADSEAKIYYTNNPEGHGQYIRLFNSNGYRVLILDDRLDIAFMQQVEGEEKISFSRIDESPAENLKAENQEDLEHLRSFFTVFEKDFDIEVQSLKSGDIPAIIFTTEEGRRMEDMSRMYNMDLGMAEGRAKLIINSKSELVQALNTMDETNKGIVVEHIVDMAELNHKPLPAARLEKFMSRSSEILKKLAGI